MNVYRLLADVVVVVHFAYVAFVVVGLVLILVGVALRWRWVRNFWFRALHFLAIAVVAFESLGGIVCPLTTWEYQLRLKAGDAGVPGSFVGRFVQQMLFFEASESVFTACYCAFAAAVLLTLVLAPPHWPWKGRETRE